MISYLKGRIKIKNENSIILQVGNIGYQVFISSSLLEKVKEGEEISIFTYLYFRENVVELYGFKDIKEMDFFKQLNKITGVGPKSALGVLSAGDLEELKNSIANNETGFLTKVSGIGRKTAERIILELKNKIKSSGEGKFEKNDNWQLKDALLKLGYQNKEIKEVLDKIPNEVKDLEGRIKEALKLLGK